VLSVQAQQPHQSPNWLGVSATSLTHQTDTRKKNSDGIMKLRHNLRYDITIRQLCEVLTHEWPSGIKWITIQRTVGPLPFNPRYPSDQQQGCIYINGSTILFPVKCCTVVGMTGA
jgi:hypothetical protein